MIGWGMNKYSHLRVSSLGWVCNNNIATSQRVSGLSWVNNNIATSQRVSGLSGVNNNIATSR